jgi:hypothetical protein
LKSSEAKSYPIVKGFEKQRTLPTIPKQVTSHDREISYNPQNSFNATSRPMNRMDSKRTEDFAITDADAIEYVSPKRLGTTKRQERREQSYTDGSKCLSGQQKLQKYRLHGGNLAAKEGQNCPAVDLERIYDDDDITGREFNDDFQSVRADDCAIAPGIEEHEHTRLPYDTIFNVSDDDFGRQGTSSDTADGEENYALPVISEQHPSVHHSYPYVIEAEPSSPSPVGSFSRNDMSMGKQRSDQSYGMGPKTKSLRSTAPSKIIGPSEGIARRAFEIARGKAQDDQKDDEDRGR